MLSGEKKAQPTYTVLRRLDGGAAGIVNVVWHDVFKREMVQKTVDVLGLEDAVAYQEPQLLDRVDHPRIVRVREAQPDPDHPAAVTMVMEYLPEGSVAAALDSGRSFGVRGAVGLACDVLDALDHLHAVHGFLHRDVKTSNVLLEQGGSRAMLTDLGSAAPVKADGSCLAAGGTLLYRAPEFGSGSLTVRADLYGVGVLLLELLGGPLRFEGLDPARMEASVAAGRRAFPERMVVFEPHVPDRVRTLVRGLLAPDPRRRPERASVAAGLLRDVRLVDWTRVSGSGPDGEWEGRGLPRRRGDVREYRVTSRVLRAGPHRGDREVSVSYRSAGAASWRRLRPDTVVGVGDGAVLKDGFGAATSHAFQS